MPACHQQIADWDQSKFLKTTLDGIDKSTFKGPEKIEIEGIQMVYSAWKISIIMASIMAPASKYSHQIAAAILNWDCHNQAHRRRISQIDTVSKLSNKTSVNFLRNQTSQRYEIFKDTSLHRNLYSKRTIRVNFNFAIGKFMFHCDVGSQIWF